MTIFHFHEQCFASYTTNLSIPNDSRDFFVPICGWDRVSTTLLTRDIAVQSFRTVTRLDDFTQRWLLANDERCAWRALVFIVFDYAGGEGEGRGKGRGNGVSRFARIWSQISNAHISKTVRARSLWYAKLTKSTNALSNIRHTTGKGWKWWVFIAIGNWHRYRSIGAETSILDVEC